MNSWNKIIKPVVVLSVICIVITGALAVTNGVTAPRIREATLLAQEKARKDLVPDAVSFEKVEGVSQENVSEVYLSDNDYAVITSSAKGYGGAITVMTAVSPEGTVSQIRITQHSETMGLGSKIVSDPDFQPSFAGLSAYPVQLTDIDAISGATKSSKAVVAAVNSALEAYEQIDMKAGETK